MSTKKEKSDNVKYEEQNLSMITKELRSQTKDLEKQIKAMQDNNWLCPSDCVNCIEPLNSTLKFDHKMSHSCTPIRYGHGAVSLSVEIARIGYINSNIIYQE